MEKLNKEAEVVKLFFEVGKYLKCHMKKSLEAFGLTMPQSMVIGVLTEYGEMKISDLSKKMNLTNSTISGIIDRLEKLQLVKRTRSTEDRRAVYVDITPEVVEIHKNIHLKVRERFKDILGKGTPDEMEKIIVGLNTLKNILQSERDE